MIDLKRITVPVFLIYAGIIHAIGLALLMPMIVTLPGPGSLIAPKPAPAAAELDPAEADTDQTSALSAPPRPVEDAAPKGAPAAGAAPKPDAPGDVANVSPPAQPEGHDKAAVKEKAEAAPEAKDKAKADAAKPVKSVKKPVAHRGARPSVRRLARKDTKIAPFGGGMSGLFTPGAPAKRR